MKFKLRYLNIINPFYYIGKKKTEKIEREVWGEYEVGGIDFIDKMDVNTEKHSRYQITRPQHMKFVKEYLDDQNEYSDAAEPPVRCGVSHLSGQT